MGGHRAHRAWNDRRETHQRRYRSSDFAPQNRQLETDDLASKTKSRVLPEGYQPAHTKDKKKPARLHDTQSKKPEKSINIGKSAAGKHPKGDGETSGTKVRSGKLGKTNKASYHYK